MKETFWEWLRLCSPLVAVSAIVLVLWYINTARYQERIVARAKRRLNWKSAKEKAEAEITKALEAAADNGIIDRIQLPRLYGMLRKAGFKEVSNEPSFGKPWYYGPSMPNVKALKGKLKQKWDHVHLRWTKEGNAISESDTTKLRQSIRKAN